MPDMPSQQLLSHDGSHWVWLGGYATKDTPKSAKMRWDGASRRWWTDRVEVAQALARYADQAAKTALEAEPPTTPPRLGWSNGKWEWFGGYETKDTVKQAGMYWDKDKKQWWTDRSAVARSLSRYADADAQHALADAASEVEASWAASANVALPCPEGREYLGYQVAGIQYALKRPGTLLADAMGLGKTIQAIGVCNASADVMSVLVICPATVRQNWRREYQRWSTRAGTVTVISSGVIETVELIGLATPPISVTIANYEQLAKLNPAPVDLLIVDEAHYCKSRKAKRTQAVAKAAAQAKKRLILTGTPIVNRPVELYSLLSITDPNAYPADGVFKTGFAKRYCGAVRTKYGWDLSGATNLPELQETLRSSLMIRRLKEDVLKELPAKRRQIIVLPLNGAREIVEREAQSRESSAQLEILRAAVELAKASEDPQAYDTAVRNLEGKDLAVFTEMSRARHTTALAKTPYIAEHVRDACEDDPQHKIVIMAHHHDVIDKLARDLSDLGVVTLTGETQHRDRDQAVQRFQNDPNVRIFIGSIQAAGVGITLTASSHVVFAELDWVPGNISQAEDRCHRIGQTDSVLVQHIVLDGSIDARLVEVIVEKQKVLESALNTKHADAEPLTVPEFIAHVVPVSVVPVSTDAMPLPELPDQSERIKDVADG
jgi:SWI/SNF-related matrix-associated actin-dependent regulator 1 of chromatin subfamily A